MSDASVAEAEKFRDAASNTVRDRCPFDASVSEALTDALIDAAAVYLGAKSEQEALVHLTDQRSATINATRGALICVREASDQVKKALAEDLIDQDEAAKFLYVTNEFLRSTEERLVEAADRNEVEHRYIDPRPGPKDGPYRKYFDAFADRWRAVTETIPEVGRERASPFQEMLHRFGAAVDAEFVAPDFEVQVAELRRWRENNDQVRGL